ncbi:MAG: NAD-dependent protein deacetylase [Gammaproteobacteria bacterium]
MGSNLVDSGHLLDSNATSAPVRLHPKSTMRRALNATPNSGHLPQPAGLEALSDLLRGCRRIAALTGAGCSTCSGIPDYRNADGDWKHSRPVLYPDFVASAEVRRRYWGRSLVGWPRFAAALPNPAHRALAELERRGLLASIVTQNVDRLHQSAGSQDVIDLHGRLDQVRCLGCDTRLPRADWQAQLGRANPDWSGTIAQPAPDGDAIPASDDYSEFQVPGCPACNGIVKPDVVFYGEAVPADVGRAARLALEQSDALLVVGSSLMVYSGFSLVRDAAAAGKPVAAINIGRTRADTLFRAHWREDCAVALPLLVGALCPASR